MDDFKNIIVGIDFSQRSITAARLAVSFASKSNARVGLVNVVETNFSDSEARLLGKDRDFFLDILVQEAQEGLEDCIFQLDYSNLYTSVLTGDPVTELTRYFDEVCADVLVVGDNGAGSVSSQLSIGSTAYRLVEQGPNSVFIVKPVHSNVITSVAAAISFVPVAERVMQEAHRLALLNNAELHVVRAIPDVPELRHKHTTAEYDLVRLLDESVKYNTHRLNDFVKSHEINDVAIKTDILSGKPGPTLVEYLRKQEIDVVVLGTGTSYRIAGFPLGSVTHRVLNQTLANVYVVRSLTPRP